MFYVFIILKGKAPLKISVSSYMLKCDYSPVDDFIVATCESNKHIFRKWRKLVNQSPVCRLLFADIVCSKVI